FTDGKLNISDINEKLKLKNYLESLTKILYLCETNGILSLLCPPLDNKQKVELGHLLVAFNHITKEQLALAREKQQGQKDKKIRDILNELGFLNVSNVDELETLTTWYNKVLGL